LPEEEEEQEVVLRNRNIEPAIDEEFNREFAKMMSEALESRKTTSKTAFDVDLPTVRTRTQSTEQHLDPQRVQFAVLSRRNKQVLSTFCPQKLTIDENIGDPKREYFGSNNAETY
jgi:hypothetical protein